MKKWEREEKEGKSGVEERERRGGRRGKEKGERGKERGRERGGREERQREKGESRGEGRIGRGGEGHVKTSVL